MKRFITKMLIEIVIVMGAGVIGLLVSQLLFDFTDLPEKVCKAAGPISFVIVGLFCAVNLRVGKK